MNHPFSPIYYVGKKSDSQFDSAFTEGVRSTAFAVARENNMESFYHQETSQGCK